MSKNIIDLTKKRQDKRQSSGWTIEEIKKNAEDELAVFQKIPNEEPENLASGDMDKIINGEEGD